MTKKLQAFFNNPKIKEKYLGQIEQHYKLDEIIHRIYWEDGKGCCVGCLVHSSDHKQFEIQIGLPEWLAHLVDFLFENMNKGKAKEFPVQFIKSINVGTNYEIMYHEFIVFLLEQICKWNKEKHPDVTEAISTIINYHKKIVDTNDLDSVKDGEWSAAWSAAESAARSAAWSAAESAARSTAVERIAEKLLELLKKYD